MAEGKLISNKDLRRVEKMLRWFEHSGLGKHFRRRNISAGGAKTHFAYCKTDAPASNIITCYLNEDETGEEIDVYCIIFAASVLNECIPELKDGDKIVVMKMSGEWWCISNVFNGYVECEYEPPG